MQKKLVTSNDKNDRMMNPRLNATWEVCVKWKSCYYGPQGHPLLRGIRTRTVRQLRRTWQRGIIVLRSSFVRAAAIEDVRIMKGSLLHSG
ncbi:hypothetical protein D3C77_747770 [compost metagenome]